MRRTIAIALVAFATIAAPLTTTLTAEARLVPVQGGDRVVADPSVRELQADTALARAAAVLSGNAGADRDATMALVALRNAYPDLSPAEQGRADEMFARPSTTAVQCDVHVCLHYTPGANSAGDQTTDVWAATTLAAMESVWTYEVDTLGYRAPADDGSVGGGDGQFDVYTENLLDDKLYGYCSAETLVPGEDFRYSGFCVLDNDYVGYQLPPQQSLDVTAAHEFFHAIQFNYDAAEDGWLMEATATWMEERYADDVNDNRAYLPEGQMKRPGTPLDTFAGLTHYGNWVFFERLSKRYGVDAVRSIWNRLDAKPGARDNYSIQGVRLFLAANNAKLTRFYADFAAGNLFPSKVYREGAAYPRASDQDFTFGKAKRSAGDTIKLKHLTSKSYSFAPNRTLKGAWKIKFTVDGPKAAEGPAAYVQVLQKDGDLVRKPMALDNSGKGSLRVSFTRSTVARVTLSVVNAGTQYSCFSGGAFSCQGTSKNNGNAYKWTAAAVR